jgi:hypothetical protein
MVRGALPSGGTTCINHPGKRISDANADKGHEQRVLISLADNPYAFTDLALGLWTLVYGFTSVMLVSIRSSTGSARRSSSPITKCIFGLIQRTLGCAVSPLTSITVAKQPLCESAI